MEGLTARIVSFRPTKSRNSAFAEASFRRLTPKLMYQSSFWRQIGGKSYADNRKLTRPQPEALKHLGLVQMDDSGKWLPTVAAVLLFAEHPGGLLNRKCAIRIFHYKGHEVESGPNTNLVRPPTTIDGPVLQQIRAATTAVLDELSRGVQTSVDGFEFTQEYPKRVIQEAICNAVIHRDYRLANKDIHIRIFRNRIEIESPGVFPGAVTSGNISKIGTYPRNRGLVDHLREFPIPPNLDAGEGVRMIFASMEQGNFYPPIYRETDMAECESVRVTLRNEARQPEWELVYDALSKHGAIRNADVRKILNLDSTVKTSKLLKTWLDAGLIEVVDPNVGTRIREYRLSNMTDLPDEFVEDIRKEMNSLLLDHGKKDGGRRSDA